ncbi:carboxymuconolactone decarboxylase family protein [Actinomycetospora chiangmaiensis]|uniref:carboxymuconolactone decarboxylase family protein n=1 Tax=Actinomycetospora chiangmaiensis TaxID=402650 RepID=UPI00036EA366|nr:carboxymuconolactone decarboxylase family protein [Actinomycetospora chiangmaiensis]
MPSEDATTDATAWEWAYTQLFGTVPPLPAAKLRFLGDVAPAALDRVEKLRAGAFFDETLDPKTVQLLLFAMLLVQGSGPARWHALAARRAGAAWEELAAVVDLATAVSALGPSNLGGQVLEELRRDEDS